MYIIVLGATEYLIYLPTLKKHGQYILQQKCVLSETQEE